jgi:hypothetical protein
MSYKEAGRLFAFQAARRLSFNHTPVHIGRRRAKGIGKHIGQKFIKGAKETHEVSLERVFNQTK